MKKEKRDILVPKQVMPTTEEDKALLKEVAEKLKGREFFHRKIEWAKNVMKDVKSLPI